jgi:pSer/pThr/pTyr-binding forkhead associated (FHA) protein
VPALSPPVADPATSAEVKDWIAAEATGDPFLLVRDDRGRQTVLLLSEHQRVTVGRRPSCDVCVGWDAKVSRVHAALEHVGDSWVVVDDGLSHNGTFINGDRVTGRRRLADSDAIRVGDTVVVYCDPEHAESQPTVTSIGPRIARRITPAQRRMLVALCRPSRDGRLAAPATNREIAGELHLAEDSVKSGLRDLFPLFGVDDLPPNQKRAQLVVNAMRTGVVSRRDL